MCRGPSSGSPKEMSSGPWQRGMGARVLRCGLWRLPREGSYKAHWRDHVPCSVALAVQPKRLQPRARIDDQPPLCMFSGHRRLNHTTANRVLHPTCFGHNEHAVRMMLQGSYHCAMDMCNLLHVHTHPRTPALLGRTYESTRRHPNTAKCLTKTS